jgi:hypothetical protein
MSDSSGHNFKIMARVDTTKAGVWVCFYCENLLVCRTSQQLAFNYSKKPNSALPAPILNEPGDKVMYVFENTRELYAVLQANRDSEFSERI